MPTFTMGFEENSRLTMSVTTPSRIDDWIFDVTVEITAGSFSGKYNAFIFEQELTRLRDELNRIYKSLSASLKFETLGFAHSQTPLEFEVTGNGRGQFDVVGVARHQNNRLVFNTEFDQSYIPAMMRELDEIIECP